MGYMDILDQFIEKYPPVPIVHQCSLCHNFVIVSMFKIPTKDNKTVLTYMAGVPASCPICQLGILKRDNNAATLDEKEVKNYI